MALGKANGDHGAAVAADLAEAGLSLAEILAQLVFKPGTNLTDSSQNAREQGVLHGPHTAR